MEVEFSVHEKNEAKFTIKGERHSLPALLRHYLLKDKGVEFAAYQMSHPLFGSPVFTLKTEGKTVDKALADAADAISSDLKDLKKQFKSAK